MSDFEIQLTTMLDDVAAGIQPRSNFDAVAPGGVGVVPAAATAAGGGGRPFRRGLAVAAASVMLLGGIAAAAYPRDGDADLVATSSSLTEQATTEPSAPTTVAAKDDSGDSARADRPVLTPAGNPVEEPSERREDRSEPKPEPAVGYTAELGEASLENDPIEQVVVGTASPGERALAESEYGAADAIADDDGRWRLTLVLDDVPAGSKVGIRVTFDASSTVFEFAVEVPGSPATTVPPKPEPEPEPKPEPEPEPDPVEFTATLGNAHPSASPMKQVLYGTATPGSKVLATSAYGHATATAGSKGGWELVLKMYEVPAPSSVHITVSVNTGGPQFEFWVERPAPEPEPEPEPVDFTAVLANTHYDGELTKVVLYGTGQPGSGVLASSEYGVEDARVNEKGKWEIALKLWDIPAGHEAGIRVTNTAAEAVYEFVVHQPDNEPEPIDFTASAALTESDRTPPVNEYWGTSTAGAKITISSPYGGKQVEANGDGLWDARVEFPEAPVGETFVVRITSSKGEAVYEFPFERVAPE